ncbi:hypothetical protein DL764_000922 [Monosporascus ibericus]|uniref:RZ-type domain-containing protein n=1 Tax=Monosporascus ibericus TaxID=155417 RepID=A0A4Q4TWM6_9PEZI|nr:hypothetical protein DL764_000922 [Monosporascus ibericus]
MDGIMDMKAHCHMSDDENPIAIAKASKPFSMKEVKVCPTCRGSLRTISRYGPIVRRAMMDEATKKFIAWSKSECFNSQRAWLIYKMVLNTERPKQLHMICDWVDTDRYSRALSLLHKISAFIGQVRKKEQLFQRIANFVGYAARQREIQGDFAFDSSELQVKGYLQASALRLKCETIIFSDFLEVSKKPATAWPKIFSKYFKDCEDLIELAISSKYPRQEVEGHICNTQFLAFARAFAVEEAESTDHIASARGLVERYPSTKLLEPEINAVEVLLRDGGFYQKVSANEMRAIYEAMRKEFVGAGHWYTCRNGHPFTVGECGVPMEQASCPECGEAVGGGSHILAEGVQRADEIEDLARNLGRMDV